MRNLIKVALVGALVASCIRPTAPIKKQVFAETPKPIAVVVAKPQIDTPAVVQPEPPKVYPVGCEAYRVEVAKYNWNTTIALKVMKAESGCNPNAVGDNRVIGGIYAPSCGLFQVRTLPGRPSCEELKKPHINVAYAHRLYLASKWKPWSVCKTKVRCY